MVNFEDILGYHGNLVTMTTNCDPLSHRPHGMCQFDVSLVFVSHILLKIQPKYCCFEIVVILEMVAIETADLLYSICIFFSKTI